MKQARIIVGANYGDEGKGTVVAKYTKIAALRGNSVLNVLTNGGSQRGHSIITATGDSHTFKHFGSGLTFGADTLFSHYYIVNPMQFQKERNEHGVDAYLVYMHEDCKWTTPYDALYNMCIEHARGKERHGTCAMGIWNTIERYDAFTNPMKFSDFVNYCCFTPTLAKQYLTEIRAWYDTKGVPFTNEDAEYAWKSDSMMDHFMQDCIQMYNKVITFRHYDEIFNNYDEVIFENGQGLQLMNMGERSTPSNTGIHDAMQILSGRDVDVSVHYVTRPYITKHGYGEFNDEQDKKFIANDIKEDRTNHYNEWQGNFRFGKLDIVDLSHRLYRDYHVRESIYQENFTKTLEITHCDEMDRVNEFKSALPNFNINTYDTAKV